MNIHPTTANFPGTPFVHAVSLAHRHKFNFEHMQLCPQQLGQLDDLTVERLQEKFPDTQFRLHANVTVLKERYIFDASSDFESTENQHYISNIQKINSKLKSSVYSYHAGYRTSSLQQMKTNCEKLTQVLDTLVAVEGLYPDKDNKWLVNNIDEYEWMAHHLPFALDLSHLQIVYHQTKKEVDLKWVTDMLTHPNCKEIHIAGNDGVHDNHKKMTGNEWWIGLLDNPDIKADIFTEENYKVIQKVI